jgi:hypothetical protein
LIRSDQYIAKTKMVFPVSRKTELTRGRTPAPSPIALIAILIGLGLNGCAIGGARITDAPRLALSPQKGTVTLQVRPGKPVGNIVPADVAVANGTDEPYRIDPAQVIALDLRGRQIRPVPLEEAVAEMARANALATELKGAAKTALVSGVAGAAAGAAVGAAVGTIVASPAQGALLGAAIGGGVGATGGAIVGGLKGHAAARYDAEMQISTLTLRAQDLNPNSFTSGYVFFPKGAYPYAKVELNLLNEETDESVLGASSGTTVEFAPSTETGTTSRSAIEQSRSQMPQADASTNWQHILPPTKIE